MAAYVEMDQVTKTYQMGEVTIKAADGISFQVEKGEFVVVVGPSGAGKTTVLNILGGMDTATTGKVSVDGTRVDKLKGKKGRDRYPGIDEGLFVSLCLSRCSQFVKT